MRESPALIESRAFGVRNIPLLRPLGWLARGWLDLMRCPLPGLLHGLALALFGGGLIVLAYGIHKLDPVIILGQMPGVVIYSRNLWLIHKGRDKDHDGRPD